MCEFFADFEGVQFVRGADAAVPDFLNRPWEEPIISFHVLSHVHGSMRNSPLAMTAQVGQSVAVLGVCSDDCISATPHGAKLHLLHRAVQEH